MEGQYFEGLGRRKRATARVRIYPGGNGQFMVNGQTYTEYFGREIDRNAMVEPFQLVSAADKYDVSVVVVGGGITGQAEAVRMGASRALIKHDPDCQSALRRAGFLTRDAREKERKKPGLRRARKATQYTKR
ncbi:MAG: 30S ribosomal protein S9 [Anaerolineae bacterium]|nr:30S ribosomal protein S9 [Anaerolineae bacterium]